jgi:hypothetical protein
MRFIVFAIAILFATEAASAEGWKEYVYLGFKFAISFPAQPKVEDVDYMTPDGLSVKGRVYSLEQDNKVYTMTVADFSRTQLDEFGVLDRAIASLTKDAAIKLDLRCRFNLVYTCREMSIVRRDGSHSVFAAMFYQHQLCQVEAIASLCDPDPATGDIVRFQRSFRFTDFAYQ